MQDHGARRRITTALLIGLIAEAFNKIAPLLIMRYSQGRLGMERFGHAQFTMSVVEMFFPFVTFGYATLAAVEIGKHLGDDKTIGSIIGNVTLLRLINAALALAGLMCLVHLVPRYQVYAPLAQILSFMLFSSAIDMLFVMIADQKMSIFSSITIIAKLLSLAAILVWVNGPQDYAKYAVFSYGANALISIGSAVFATRRFQISVRVSEFKSLFFKAIPYAINLLMLTFFSGYDLFLAEHLNGSVSAGLYAAPSRLARSLTSVVIAISMVFFSEMLGTKSNEVFTQRVRQAFWALNALLLPLALGIWFVDREVLATWMGTDAFMQQGIVLSTLVVAVLFFGGFYLFGFQALAAKGHIAKVNAAIGMACVIGVVVGMLSSRLYGLLGVALSFALSNAIGATICYLIFKRHYQISLKGEFIRTLLPALGMASVLAIIPRLPLVAEASVGIGTYLLLFLPANHQRIRVLYGSKAAAVGSAIH